MEKNTTILALEALAQRITEHSENSDHSRLEAARLLAEARRRVDAGEIPGVTWKDWTEKNLSLSPSRIKELLEIGQADDPAAALARQRAKTRTRVKSHRKQKAARDSEREQGAVGSDTREPDVTKTGALAPVAAMPNFGALDKVEIERQDLIVWVKQASIEAVRFATDAIYLEYGFFLGKTSGNPPPRKAA